MRVGVFGGTFDPVHLGHLILAEQCREQARLDQVWFVPSARPPHKQDHAPSPFFQRVEMLNVAIAGHSAFRVDELEKERAGPSYTADTLAELQQQHPGVELNLILGADCLPDLPTWYQPLRILEQAVLLVVPRPGTPVWSAEQLQHALALPAEIEVRMRVIASPLIEIASREIRQKVAEGKSVRFLVPRAVECYMETHGVYRA